ncbi:hypothetical protein CI610_02664 [invertebrate metagenome]|uniref:Uncharacterized protein n=1 Tax=invertebrate metagenome TaxID=1711999 RepID=A0A2H9T598_9ZZZZ
MHFLVWYGFSVCFYCAAIFYPLVALSGITQPVSSEIHFNQCNNLKTKVVFYYLLLDQKTADQPIKLNLLNGLIRYDGDGCRGRDAIIPLRCEVKNEERSVVVDTINRTHKETTDEDFKFGNLIVPQMSGEAIKERGWFKREPHVRQLIYQYKSTLDEKHTKEIAGGVGTVFTEEEPDSNSAKVVSTDILTITDATGVLRLNDSSSIKVTGSSNCFSCNTSYRLWLKPFEQQDNVQYQGGISAVYEIQSEAIIHNPVVPVRKIFIDHGNPQAKAFPRALEAVAMSRSALFGGRRYQEKQDEDFSLKGKSTVTLDNTAITLCRMSDCNILRTCMKMDDRQCWQMDTANNTEMIFATAEEPIYACERFEINGDELWKKHAVPSCKDVQFHQLQYDFIRTFVIGSAVEPFSTNVKVNKEDDIQDDNEILQSMSGSDCTNKQQSFFEHGFFRGYASVTWHEADGAILELSGVVNNNVGRSDTRLILSNDQLSMSSVSVQKAPSIELKSFNMSLLPRAGSNAIMVLKIANNTDTTYPAVVYQKSQFSYCLCKWNKEDSKYEREEEIKKASEDFNHYEATVNVGANDVVYVELRIPEEQFQRYSINKQI